MTTIKSFTVETAVVNNRSNGGGVGAKRADRVNGMKAFWANPSNSSFLIVGRFLANLHQGKTLAAHLIAGEEFNLSSLAINGQVLPLADGTVISLKSITSWACPACASAHGSGVGPSSEVNEKLLASNEFYYNPATKKLFTISSTCWSEYVKVLNAAGRFKQVESPVAADKPVVKADKK